MKDTKILELDKYELRIIVNALNEFRNKTLANEEDSTCIDELLLKVLDAPKKKRLIFQRKYATERQY